MWLLKIGDPLIEVTTHAGLTVSVAAPVNSNYQTADDKIFICKFSKMLSPRYIILRIQRLEGKQCKSR